MAGERIRGRLAPTGLWLDAAFLAAALAYVVAGAPLVPFFGDEATLIGMSRDYDALVQQQDPSQLLYSPGRQVNLRQQTIRLMTGSVDSFLIGLARAAAHVPASAVNGLWDWSYPPGEDDAMWLANLQEGNLPSPALLRLARLPSVLMGSFSLVFLFLASRSLTQSRMVAWLGTALVASNGRFLVEVRRAMQEGSKYFFLFMALFIAARILELRRDRQGHRLAYVLLGMASGMALASKQDIAIALVAIYLALVVTPVFEAGKRDSILENAVLLTASMFVALAVFFAAMPVLWIWWPNIVICACLALILMDVPALRPVAASTGNEEAPISSPTRADSSSRNRLWRPPVLLAISGLIAVTAFSPRAWTDVSEPVKLMLATRRQQLNAQIAYQGVHGLPYFHGIQDKVSFFASVLFSSKATYFDTDTQFDVAPIRAQIAGYEASGLGGRQGPMFLDALIGILAVFGLASAVRHPSAENVLVVLFFFVPAVFQLLLTPIPVSRYFVGLQAPYAFFAALGALDLWAKRNRFIKGTAVPP